MPDYYIDPTPIDNENWVNIDKVDELHKKLARWIREKMYGIDVREALARLVEQTSSDLYDANQTALSLENLANYLSNKWEEEYLSLSNEWKDTINGITVDSEVVNARIDLRGFVYKTLKERLDSMQAAIDKLNPVSEIFAIEHNQFRYPVVRVLSLEYGIGIVPLESEPIFGGSNVVSVNCDVEYLDRNSLKVKVPLAYAMAKPTIERISTNEYLLVEGIKSLIIEIGEKSEANVETFVTRRIKSDFTGKISNSKVENSNDFRYGLSGATNVQLPSQSWGEGEQIHMDGIKKIDGVSANLSRLGAGLVGQWKIEYDAFWILEQLSPSIFVKASTIAEKYALAKKVITGFSYEGWAKASGPNSTLCTHTLFNPVSGSWGTTATSSGTTISQRIIPSANASTPVYLNPNGLYYFAVYAPPSDGVSASSVSIDYSSITLTVRIPYSKI